MTANAALIAVNAPSRGWTPKFVESVRPRDQIFEIADPVTPGLVLRVHPSGVKSFRWYVRGPGWRRAVTIGPWSSSPSPAFVTLAEARTWLARLKSAHAGGLERLDAVITQLKIHLAPRPAPEPGAPGTVDTVAERFLNSLNARRKRPEEARQVYKKDIKPMIGALPLGSVKKSDCRAVVAKVVARGAKVHAGKVLGLLKQLLDYAENVEDDFVNPAARLKAANLEIEHNVRTRWLSEQEIPLFWRALDLQGAPEQERDRRKTRAALRLLLLTACRSGELRLARREDLDFEASTWTIPVANQKLSPKHAKTAKPFVVPLTPTVVALFKELLELGGGSPWVLASDASEFGFYTDKALGRAMSRIWQAHPDLKRLPAASPHDLRRTARTWLGRLGVPPHVAERCLNHRLGRIIETYVTDR